MDRRSRRSSTAEVVPQSAVDGVVVDEVAKVMHLSCSSGVGVGCGVAVTARP
jgi:hypothetical protein